MVDIFLHLVQSPVNQNLQERLFSSFVAVFVSGDPLGWLYVGNRMNLHERV